MRIDPGKMPRREGPRATELFTDRESEAKVLKNALAAHRRRLDNEDEDMSMRHNVLVYYGVGGLGKSTLSERLEDWVNGRLPLMNGWGRKPSTDVSATVRVDLRDQGGQFDVVRVVVAIRRELGRLKKQWPAFDFAFAAYWEAAHPGEPLPTQGSSDNGFAEAVGETLENVFTDLDVLGSVVGIGSRSARAAVRELQRRRLRRLAFESYDGYRDLLEQCAELPSPAEPRPDLVIELALLLAVDLSLDWRNGAPLVVVFVDTVERLMQDPRRIGEKRLNQLVWNLPHVLFVITGRNLVDWFDERRSNLYVAGPSVWPGLRPGTTSEPRQHLVGKLSPSDTRQVILLARQKYKVRISDPVVDELVAASGGLPLYLDLALAVALNAETDGAREVTVADVTGSLNDLVMRVLEDIPEDEQRAIRAASMFAYFDTGLIAAAADVDYGTAERAVRRPMVDAVEVSTYPYRLHDEIRSAIRWSDHRVPGGWSARDWNVAGSRALAEARRRYEASAKAGDGESCLASLGLAIGIVCDQELEIGESPSPFYRDWLSEAIVKGPSLTGLAKYVPVISTTRYGQGVLDFVAAKSYEVPAEERTTLLRSIFKSEHALAVPAGRHLAYGLRNQSLWDDSVAVFDELIAMAPTELNRYQRLLTLASGRRFREALAGLEELSTRRESLESTIDSSHGRPEFWLSRVDGVLERTAQQGRQRDRLEHQGAALRWRTFLVGDVQEPEIAVLLRQAEAVGYETLERECLSAMALLAPGSEDEDPTIVDRLEYLDRRANDGRLGFRTATVRTARAFVCNDTAALQQIRRQIEQQPIRGRHWIPVECLLDSLGLSIQCPECQWLEPYEIVKGRWAALFERYRHRIKQR